MQCQNSDPTNVPLKNEHPCGIPPVPRCPLIRLIINRPYRISIDPWWWKEAWHLQIMLSGSFTGNALQFADLADIQHNEVLIVYQVFLRISTLLGCLKFFYLFIFLNISLSLAYISVANAYFLLQYYCMQSTCTILGKIWTTIFYFHSESRSPYLLTIFEQ